MFTIVKTERFGKEILRFLGQKLWKTLLADIKESESLPMFKGRIQMYMVSCDCSLCKCKRYASLQALNFLFYFAIVDGLNLPHLCYCASSLNNLNRKRYLRTCGKHRYTA